MKNLFILLFCFLSLSCFSMDFSSSFNIELSERSIVEDNRIQDQDKINLEKAIKFHLKLMKKDYLKLNRKIERGEYIY